MDCQVSSPFSIADLIEDFLVQLALDDHTQPNAKGNEGQQQERRSEIGQIQLTQVCIRNDLRVVGEEEEPDGRANVDPAIELLWQEVGHDRRPTRVRHEARESGKARPEDATRP